jgi:hypothetical protein
VLAALSLALAGMFKGHVEGRTRAESRVQTVPDSGMQGPLAQQSAIFRHESSIAMYRQVVPQGHFTFGYFLPALFELLHLLLCVVLIPGREIELFTPLADIPGD